jgi:hypothetical protein
VVDVEKHVFIITVSAETTQIFGNLPHRAFRSLDNMAGQPGTKYCGRGSLRTKHGIVMTRSSRHFACGGPAADHPWNEVKN